MGTIRELQAKIRRLTEAETRQAVKENFEEIWATKGAAIGADWQGNDLVRTGRLYSIMTDPALATWDDGVLNIPLPPQYVALNEKYRFFGLTEKTRQKFLGGV